MTTVQLIGTLRRTADGRGAVRMEDRYDTGIDDLWSALTDPARLARWVADVAGDLRVGGHFQARFTSGWEGPGRVDGCEAPHHLLVTLSPGTEEETAVEATLTAEDGRTRLVVEERGIPVDQLAGHGAGWQAHVEDLAAHLRGEPVADWAARWQALIPDYAQLPVSDLPVSG
jgi:uncharacterized protein YndB with AHSA1/START domain